jgi:hypothetical protein
VTLYVADPLRPRLVLQPWEAPTSVDTQLDLLILLLACSIMFNNFHLQLEDSLHLSAINENRCLRTRRGSYPQLVVSLIRYYSKLCVFSSRFQDAFHSCAWGCKWASSEDTLPLAANILSLRIWNTALIIQQISEFGLLQPLQPGSFVAWFAAVWADDGAPCEGFVSRCLVQCFIMFYHWFICFQCLCEVIFRFNPVQIAFEK